jgi:tRNA (adenine57-N1/adenine58-N1)-methyltransferase catalytic subunit
MPHLTGPVGEGERVMLIDQKRRRYHLLLKPGKSFRTHLGVVSHEAILGCQEGTRIMTSEGAEFLLFRPSTSDFVVKMGRPTNILYPKDVGLITAFAGIGCGSFVVEAGTGSGSGTIALARAVGESGSLVSYERRAEFQPDARANIASMFAGQVPAWLTLKVGDVFTDLSERDIDAVVLDLPEPWLAIEAAAAALRRGGFFVAYVPTTSQLQETIASLEEDGRFAMISSFESLLRPWEVSGRSVRPAHRMTAHTGFLTFARLCERRRPD